jgi:PAS domain S-box-containing protein
MAVQRKTKSSLEQLETRLLMMSSIVENSNNFIGLCTPDLKPFFINRAGREMVGLGPDVDIRKTQLLDYIWPEDRKLVEATAFSSLRQGICSSGEMRFRNFKTGKPIQTVWNAFVIEDESGRTIAWATNSPNLSRQKENELRRVKKELEVRVKERTEELVEKARILESFYEHTQTCLMFLDKHFNFIRVNKAYALASGHKVSDFDGHNYFTDYPSDELRAKFQRVVETRQPYSVVNYRPSEFQDLPERSISYWDLYVAPVLKGSGEVDFLFFSLIDVTKRKKAEESMARLTLLYAVLSRVNEAIVHVRGANELYSKVCRIAVEYGRFKMAWIGIADPDTGRVNPVADYGDSRGYLDNITIHAADAPDSYGPAEKAIAEKRYTVCSDIAHDPAMLPCRDIALLHGFRSSAAFPFFTASGVIGTFMIYADTPRFFTDEEISLFQSLVRNISYAIDSMSSEEMRLEAENALRKSASEIQDLYNNSPCGYHSLSKAGLIIRINNTELDWLGYSREEVAGKIKFIDLLTPGSSRAMKTNLIRLKKTGRITDLELEMVRKDGTVLPVLLNATAISDKNGRFLMCRSNIFDITGRKEAEFRTSATNELLKLFSQTMLRKEYLDALVKHLKRWSGSDCAGIRVLDEDENIPYCSSTGFSRDFCAQEDRLSIRKNSCACTRIIAGGRIPEDSPFLTPDGSFVCNDSSHMSPVKKKSQPAPYRGACIQHGFASIAVIPVRYRDKVFGAIHLADRRKGWFQPGIIQFIESVTPLIGEALYRFYIEEALIISHERLRSLSIHLQAAREEESTRIAREIHDDLGQTLTAAGLELSRISEKNRFQGPVSDKLRTAAEIIDGAVQDIQRICSELRPRVLDHLGLQAAVEWQANKFSMRTGISAALDLTSISKTLPAAISTAMFRILQEALMNVARHSGATEVSIYMKTENHTLVLRVRDNGKGATKQKLFSQKSFGILGIRERTHDLGGTATFNSIRNKGTTVMVTIPLKGRNHV